MKKYLITSFIIGLLGATNIAFGFSDHTMQTIYQLRQKGVKVYTNDKLIIEQPSRIQQSNTGIQKLSTNIEYRTSRLPYEQDRYASGYIVIPRLGIVTPIVDIPPSDPTFADITAGLSIDFNSYLQHGVVHYPSAKGGQVGNMIIAGHSSYWKNDTGRYKNIFFSLPLLEFGDQIRVYVKGIKGDYMRYRYMVDNSFETKPDDISVLKQTGMKRLTLFTCVPIGTINARWVIQAKIIPPAKKIIIPSKRMTR